MNEIQNFVYLRAISTAYRRRTNKKAAAKHPYRSAAAITLSVSDVLYAVCLCRQRLLFRFTESARVFFYKTQGADFDFAYGFRGNAEQRARFK